MKKGTMLTTAYACLFSACVTVGRRITFGGDVKHKIDQTYMSALTPADILVFLMIAVCAAGALVLAGRAAAEYMPLRREWGTGSYAGAAVLFSLGLLLAWSPYILTVAPGNVYIDSLESITQMLEHGHPTSNHHPMFYTLMIGVFMKIGTVLFDSVNVGILLCSMAQTTVMIGCITAVMLVLLRGGMPKLLIGVSLAYYMFMPYFPSYAMSLWKDVLFSCMLLLLSVQLYAFAKNKTCPALWYVCYGVVGVGCMAFRNNGLYVFAGASVLAAWLLRRHAKQLLLASSAAVTAFMLASSAASFVWNIHGDFVENLGIPLQQLGYAINHGNDFSEADRAYLDALMPKDVWGYAYRPCLVDTIKWNPYFNTEMLLQTKNEFFGVWLRGLIRNPLDYISGYLLATHGFWKPGVQNLYGYMDVQMNENPYGIGFMDLFERMTGVTLMPLLSDYPIIMGSGTLLWLCLFGFVLACKKEWRYGAAYFPALINWVTVMIATPVAFSLRYVYIFALGLPLYLLLPLMLCSAREKESRTAFSED